MYNEVICTIMCNLNGFLVVKQNVVSEELVWKVKRDTKWYNWGREAGHTVGSSVCCPQWVFESFNILLMVVCGRNDYTFSDVESDKREL